MGIIGPGHQALLAFYSFTKSDPAADSNQVKDHRKSKKYSSLFSGEI